MAKTLREGTGKMSRYNAATVTAEGTRHMPEPKLKIGRREPVLTVLIGPF
jgi:hypothetical protein